MAIADYWTSRQHFIYYKISEALAVGLGQGAQSVIDVGSAGTPCLDWFPDVTIRTSVDLRNPYKAEGVNSVRHDFITWPKDRRYDLATCFQVLEHVADAKAFAQKLLEVGRIVLISVPYKWKAGGTKSHIHDPVDEEKLHSWFGRQPNFHYLCREIHRPTERLIQVYDVFPERWRGLNERRKIITAAASPKTQTTDAAPKVHASAAQENHDSSPATQPASANGWRTLFR